MLLSAVPIFIKGDRSPSGEADLSAEPPSQEQGPRLPGSDAHGRRASGAEKKTIARTAPPDASLNGARQGASPRTRWLPLRSGFAEVYREGRRYSGTAVVLYFRSTGGPSRVAVAAGRRLGGSVVRNRARRRLREAFRRVERKLCGQGDLILVARHAALTGPFAAIVAEIEHLCAEGRLLCGTNG